MYSNMLDDVFHRNCNFIKYIFHWDCNSMNDVFHRNCNSIKYIVHRDCNSMNDTVHGNYNSMNDTSQEPELSEWHLKQKTKISDMHYSLRLQFS